MNTFEVVIGILTLIVSSIAAYYAKKTFITEQEPKLMLYYSDYKFILRNIGTTTARNIAEVNDCFTFPKLELLNYTGPVEINQSKSYGVVIIIHETPSLKSLKAGEDKIAQFKHENLSGKKFKSNFHVIRSKNPTEADQFSIEEIE